MLESEPAYRAEKSKTLTKAAKYGLLLAVAIGGIGLAVNLGPELMTHLGKKLTLAAAAS